MMDAKSLSSIFAKMSYNSEQPAENLKNIKKWLQETRGGTLSSIVNGKSVTGDSSKKLSVSAFGEKVGVELIQEGAIFAKNFESIRKSVAEEKQEQLKWSTERILKFQKLLQSKSSDLINLELFAGSVPAWTVKLHDEPKWIFSANSKSSKQLLNELSATGNTLIMIKLDKSSYCLENIVKILSAAIHVDQGAVIFAISLKDTQQAELLFPVLYLIEAVNESRLGAPINVLLLSDTLPQSEVLKAIHGKATIIAVGSELSDIPGLSYTSAAVDFARKDGDTIHFVITDSADIDSAISSISRNVWNCGIVINHRCRPLLFVHQSIHDSIIDGLAKSLEGIDMATYQTGKGDKPTIMIDTGTATDLVSMKAPGKGRVLVVIPYRSVAELLSLANNFGHIHETFLYSTNVSTTSEISCKLLTERLVLNDKEVMDGQILDLLFTVVAIKKSLEKRGTIIPKTLKVGPVKEWQNLVDNEKSKRLEKFIGLGDSVSDHFTKIFLAEQIKANGPIPSSRVSGIISTCSTFPTDAIKFAMTACILRGGQTVVVCPSSLALQLGPEAKEVFPEGLVSVLELESTDIANVAQNWELTWVVDGDKSGFEAGLIPRSKWNKMLIINDTREKVMEDGAAMMKQNLRMNV